MSFLECYDSKLSPEDLTELNRRAVVTVEKDSELKDYLFKLHLQKHSKEMGVDQV